MPKIQIASACVILTPSLPMHAGGILLGQPWQFDRRVKYDGYLNRYSFVKRGRKTTLVPLSSANVFADQLKLEEEKKELKEKQERSEKIEKNQREKHSEKKNEIEKKKKERR